MGNEIDDSRWRDFGGDKDAIRGTCDPKIHALLDSRSLRTGRGAVFFEMSAVILCAERLQNLGKLGEGQATPFLGSTDQRLESKNIDECDKFVGQLRLVQIKSSEFKTLRMDGSAW